MKSERQLNRHLNTLMQNSNTVWNGSTQNEPTCGIQADTKMASTSDAHFNFADDILKENGKLNLERMLEDGNSTISTKPTRFQSTMDNELPPDTNFVGELYEEFWWSLVSDSHSVKSVPFVDERKLLSAESVDSDISLLSLDNVISLDDVFEVLDETDLFRSDLPTEASLKTSSTHLRDELSQSYSSDGLYQLPIPHISSSDSCSSFQSFDFDFVKGLQSPSRGLVSAVRRLGELLSEPRSDHLNSVFVRLLNNALKEMEDAVQHQSNRPRRNNGRHRKWPNKSASDAERTFEPVSTGLSLSFISKSRSLSALPNNRGHGGSCTETVDLTGLGDWNREDFQLQQDSRSIEMESFIALEDTVSTFMHEQFPFLRSI